MSTASHSTPPATSPPAPPRSWLIAPNTSYRSWLQTCPNAQTLIANDPIHGCELVLPLPCRQWSCRFCAELKCKKLAAQTREAKPNRMLTLTVDPAKWENPRAAFDGTRRQLPVLFAQLRKRFGEIEYLRVTELTKNGWPHYHFLIRSGYLPHAVIKAAWHKLTGATIVDIRPTDKRWSAYTYLLKYLTKLHHIEWTERHVSYSRGFFPPPPDRSATRIQLERPATYSIHPATYLSQNLVGLICARVSPSVFAVSSSFEPLEALCNDYNSP